VKLPKGTKAVGVAAGNEHSLAVTSTGKVLAWGYNADGELGDGTFTGPQTCSGGEACSTTPVSVKLPKGTRAVAVAAGYEHSLALTSTGHVLAWGYNADGQLGDGSSTGPQTCTNSEACSTTPIKVKLPAGTRAVAVAVGDDDSLALTSSGQVLAWGYNADGELGDGTFTGPQTCAGGQACSTTPVRVKLPKGTKAVALAAGYGHSMAATAAGHVLAWGLNSDGQLGTGAFTGPDTCSFSEACSTTPIKANLPKGAKATALGAAPLAYDSLAIVQQK
jgi:alpha-tubulin suppressor-like RCC1 family protein